ncbi:disease resistance protein RPM1-like [Humulus lupulus]|uniref:disease resistance protein RPM1-like n=1 Tax=Humulus lupulus TaxID=3486 RepID=UPI002B4098EE|nr:disease resistance protein RPM1-like [Humulus lupulus]
MEVVAMEVVAAAVPVALALVDRVLASLSDQGGSSGAKQDVEKLKSRLSSFQSFVKLKENQKKDHVSQDLVNKIQGVTAEIEDALDDFMFEVHMDRTQPHPNAHVQSLHDLAHKMINHKPIKRLSERAKSINQRIETDNLMDRMAEGKHGSELTDLPSDLFLDDTRLVGFITRREEMLNQLISGDSKRTTIQVVGPGGSGKTFLVENVSSDQRVVTHFHCQAWLRLSRCDSSEVLVLDSRSDLTTGDSSFVSESRRVDTTRLHNYLHQKRYLIVLDNVWNRQRLVQILKDLPDQENGSRVIITTRNNIDVAADKPKHTHKLDGLIEEEAWKLFCTHAFPRSGHCPKLLEKVSSKILKKCDGLPLAIAAVGFLLSTGQRREVEYDWETFYNSLAHEIGTNSKFPIIRSVLQPSFVDLQENLKSCFLYFSIFPEGQSVSRGRLIRSWQAEGFVKEVNGKTPEEVAETYLNELIGRNLVRICSSEIDGRVRTCQVLRLFHEFIAPLSKDGNFVTVVDKNSKPSPNEKVRRLSFHESFPLKSDEMISDAKYVRTLFMFGHHHHHHHHDIGTIVDDSKKESKRERMKNRIRSFTTSSYSDQDHHLEMFLGKFRLLKVLDLQQVPVQNLTKYVGSFILLKCLNMRYTCIETVPDSIQKLVHLETLDLKYTLVKELPKWIHKLQKLRHLLVSRRSSTIICGEPQAIYVSNSGIGSISSLQKVSLIAVENVEVIKQLGRLKQLRKVGLANHHEKNGRELCESIQKMEKLCKIKVRAATAEKFLDLDHMIEPPTSIQHLNLEGGLRRFPSWIKSLSSLVKLVLKSSKLRHKDESSSPLENLESLQCLMELEMVDYYVGTKLVFKANTFKSLRKLHVEQFDELKEVVVETMALVMLQKLTICKCEKLKALPTSCSLEKLEELVVYGMSGDFIYDINRRINEGQLKNHIQRSNDEASSSSSSNAGHALSRRIMSYRHIS